MTAFGWRAGYGPATSKPTSFIQRAWPYRASIAVRKQIELDTGLLKRVFIGWLRGEPDHCHMAAISTLAEEDAKRPNREREGLVRERTRIVNRMKSCLVRFGIRNFKPTLRKAPKRLATLGTPEGGPLPPNTLHELRRDMARLRFVMDQIKEVEEARAERLEQAPQERTHAMVRLIARVIGVGIKTADMLVHEILSRKLRDRRAVARYAGLTGAPDESGSKRREKGLAKAGNARVRRGMIELAWRSWSSRKIVHWLSGIGHGLRALAKNAKQ